MRNHANRSVRSGAAANRGEVSSEPENRRTQRKYARCMANQREVRVQAE